MEQSSWVPHGEVVADTTYYPSEYPYNAYPESWPPTTSYDQGWGDSAAGWADDQSWGMDAARNDDWEKAWERWNSPEDWQDWARGSDQWDRTERWSGVDGWGTQDYDGWGEERAPEWGPETAEAYHRWYADPQEDWESAQEGWDLPAVRQRRFDEISTKGKGKGFGYFPPFSDASMGGKGGMHQSYLRSGSSKPKGGFSGKGPNWEDMAALMMPFYPRPPPNPSLYGVPRGGASNSSPTRPPFNHAIFGAMMAAFASGRPPLPPHMGRMRPPSPHVMAMMMAAHGPNRPGPPPSPSQGQPSKSAQGRKKNIAKAKAVTKRTGDAGSDLPGVGQPTPAPPPTTEQVLAAVVGDNDSQGKKNQAKARRSKGKAGPPGLRTDGEPSAAVES
mmetsp:Transcript_32693/g.71341  ORF Transcript_32693/g.71341 Transcript_32693/m.71341 type:complete len:388 (+) Transcript_32693:38-1201(+)|eukprot:CAMPEP_0204321894 /NCGR_PEP_ID=MMETSP0469-20131031/8403_1 /ASSEMBLY_ACC=CAM_ASM_000384 /TAXON_ID=2969 /ORGANISM="Oxyrrhis marina" /LENGTH=387 /DNA_ID=CAMNT_0051303217 /DNA_START=13 /DNA_END=1176 /DNA_ORIENTATION=-